ncbi:MAG: hypothetical protein AAF688_05505 [Bacteroidota bacterium]
MNNLSAVIKSLTPEEELQFELFLKRKNKRKDTKNVELFLLLKEDNLSSKEIFNSLYNSDSKAAYHALRKRLFQSLIEFISNKSINEENSIDMEIIKYLLAARNFLTKNMPKMAYKILDKAEILALEHQLFPILNEIYHTKIQYAYLNQDVELEALISKFRSNQKQQYLEEELNLVYAQIRQTLNKINYKGEVINLENVLKQTFSDHHINISESMSFKSFYQLMMIVSLSAYMDKNYLKIEPFLLKTYKSLKKHKTRHKQLFYHIQVVYMIANALFRNKKFNASINYLNEMYELMNKQGNKYKNTYILKHNLLLALNLNYNDEQEKALSILENTPIKKNKDLESVLDIQLSLLMFYMQKEDFKKAKNQASKFYHTDNYYTEKAGKEWTIKKNLAEIILFIELQDIDLVESRVRSFKRSYSSYLKSINQGRVLTFLNFVEDYFKNPEIVLQPDFENKIENSFEWIETKAEDIFVMSFYAWLKSKMDKTPLYDTTLKLVAKAQSVN